MSRNILFYGIALGITMLSLPAVASEGGHSERIKHYDFTPPKNSQEAKILYDKGIADIAAVLKNDALAVSDLEEVHRISYALEAAVETFEKEKTFEKTALDQVEHDVEALHKASEEHETEKTRAWFAKLQTANKNLD